MECNLDQDHFHYFIGGPYDGRAHPCKAYVCRLTIPFITDDGTKRYEYEYERDSKGDMVLVEES